VNIYCLPRETSKRESVCEYNNDTDIHSSTPCTTLLSGNHLCYEHISLLTTVPVELNAHNSEFVSAITP